MKKNIKVNKFCGKKLRVWNKVYKSWLYFLLRSGLMRDMYLISEFWFLYWYVLDVDSDINKLWRWIFCLIYCSWLFKISRLFLLCLLFKFNFWLRFVMFFLLYCCCECLVCFIVVLCFVDIWLDVRREEY